MQAPNKYRDDGDDARGDRALVFVATEVLAGALVLASRAIRSLETEDQFTREQSIRLDCMLEAERSIRAELARRRAAGVAA